MSSSPFTVAVCIHYFTGLECSAYGHLLNCFVRFLLTEDAQILIMGKHEAPVAPVAPLRFTYESLTRTFLATPRAERAVVIG